MWRLRLVEAGSTSKLSAAPSQRASRQGTCGGRRYTLQVDSKADSE